MSRKKWNRLTDKGKHELQKKMYDLQIKLTNLEDNWEKIYDLEETINDNISSLFECNADCDTCNSKDRAICMLNFRKANVFWLAKVKSYEEFFFDAVKYLGKFIQGLHAIIVDGKDPDDVDFDNEDKTDSEKGSTQSMFA